MTRARVLAAAAPFLAAVAGGLMLAACNGEDVVRTMIPAPIVMKDPRLDFTRRVAPDKRDVDVRVLFATTRAPAPPGASERFLRRAGDRVLLGLAHVQLGEPG